MVDTPVLEAGAERRESSSLSWGTIKLESNEKGALRAFFVFSSVEIKLQMGVATKWFHYGLDQ